MKQKWGKEVYLNCYTKKKWNNMVEGSILKLRGTRRDFEKGTCPLCMEGEDIIIFPDMFAEEVMEGNF
jgi:hypothetical protein